MNRFQCESVHSSALSVVRAPLFVICKWDEWNQLNVWAASFCWWLRLSASKHGLDVKNSRWTDNRHMTTTLLALFCSSAHYLKRCVADELIFLFLFLYYFRSIHHITCPSPIPPPQRNGGSAESSFICCEKGWNVKCDKYAFRKTQTGSGYITGAKREWDQN